MEPKYDGKAYFHATIQFNTDTKYSVTLTNVDRRR